MPITEATIRQTKYYPELLPDARYVSIGAGSEVSPPLLELRRFSPRFVSLTNIAVERNPSVWARIYADNVRRELNTDPMYSLKPNEWDVPATDYVRYNLYNGSYFTSVSNFRTTFGLWVYEPTVAHKLRHKKQLSQEEAEIAERLGIRNTVEKGLLPLPLQYMIEREYQVLFKETLTRVVDFDVYDQYFVVETIVPASQDEFIVLTSIASDPGTLASDIRISVDRDENADYVSDLSAYPLSVDGDLQCFIPALKEIKIKLKASSAGGYVTGHRIRYTIWHCALTNLIRVRFGLASRDEVPGDLWDKVKGGVL